MMSVSKTTHHISVQSRLVRPRQATKLELTISHDDATAEVIYAVAALSRPMYSFFSFLGD